MKTIILAAGRGSRMGDMTKSMPKCMIEVMGQRLLDWQLSAFDNASLKNTAIVVGYRADSFSGENAQLIHNLNWSSTNMVSSLLCASHWIASDDFIVSYSDIFYSSDVISSLKEAGGDIVITYDPNWLRLWDSRFVDPLSDAETFSLDSVGMLKEIGNKTKKIDDIEGQFMGLLKFSHNGWGLVKDILHELPKDSVNKMDMTSLLSLILKKGIGINVVAIEQGWGELDSEQDLAAYEKLLCTDAYSWMDR